MQGETLKHHSYYKVLVTLRTWKLCLKELYFVHIQRILTKSLMMLQCPLILPELCEVCQIHVSYLYRRIELECLLYFP